MRTAAGQCPRPGHTRSSARARPSWCPLIALAASLRQAPRLPRGLERQILVGGGIGEPLDVVDAGLPDARADAPEEGELVDGHVHHPVVDDLLDLVEQALALLPVQLS